jgi:hypothetical protein
MILRDSNLQGPPGHVASSEAPICLDKRPDCLPGAGQFGSRPEQFGALGGSVPTGEPSPNLPTRAWYGGSVGQRDRQRVRALSVVKRRRQFPHRHARREALRRDICNLFTWKLAEHLMARGLSQNLAATRLGVSPSTLSGMRRVFDQGGYSAIVPCLREALPAAVEWDFGEWMEL